MSDSLSPWNNPATFEFGRAECPFFDGDGSSCRASFSGMPVRRARKRLYCFSEEHDSCPLFLARMLRNSQSRSGVDLRDRLHK